MKPVSVLNAAVFGLVALLFVLLKVFGSTPWLYVPYCAAWLVLLVLSVYARIKGRR